MEQIGHNTTSASAWRLRPCTPVFTGMPGGSGRGSRYDCAPIGADVLPGMTAGAVEQGLGIRVFATGGDV
jgi:hypothetical protein